MSSTRNSEAPENTSYPGYVSEKVISSMLAGTIPIYWGDPGIGEMLNVRSFINCHDFESFDAVVEKVLEIDGDPKLLAAMLDEPFILPGQLEELVRNIAASRRGLADFLVHIVQQPLEGCRRRVWNRYCFDYSRWNENPWVKFGKLGKVEKVKEVGRMAFRKLLKIRA